jgi:hypothetical protein
VSDGEPNLQDRLNLAFQDKLYELIDSKGNGLADCTVTEIVDVAFAAIEETVNAQANH